MKTALLMVLIWISMDLCAQPFVGLAATNKGVAAQIGVLVRGVELASTYKFPYTQAYIPTIFSFTAGKLFLLTQKEKDNYSISALAGAGWFRVQDFTKYDGGEETILKISKITPVYTLELGKDAYMGRVVISANYCKSFYFGIGMKVFAFRN